MKIGTQAKSTKCQNSAATSSVEGRSGARRPRAAGLTKISNRISNPASTCSPWNPVMA